MVDIDYMQVRTFRLVSQIRITVQVRITIESSIPRFGFGRFCVLNLNKYLFKPHFLGSMITLHNENQSAQLCRCSYLVSSRIQSGEFIFFLMNCCCAGPSSGFCCCFCCWCFFAQKVKSFYYCCAGPNSGFC